MRKKYPVGQKIHIEIKSQLVNQARAITIFIDDKKVGAIKDGVRMGFEIGQDETRTPAKSKKCQSKPTEIPIAKRILGSKYSGDKQGQKAPWNFTAIVSAFIGMKLACYAKLF